MPAAGGALVVWSGGNAPRATGAMCGAGDPDGARACVSPAPASPGQPPGHFLVTVSVVCDVDTGWWLVAGEGGI